VYSDVMEGDVYEITETVGDADFQKLLSESKVVFVSPLTLITDNMIIIILIVTALLVLSVVWYFGFKEERQAKGILGIVFALVFFSPVVSFGATYALSNGDILSVTLANGGVFSADENVEMTITYTDALGAPRPAGTSLRAKIDAGAYTTILSTTTPSGSMPWVVDLAIPAGTSGGAHTLTIERPGHLFDGPAVASEYKARFGQSRFGVDTDTESISITITVNEAPTPPQVSGSCIVGDDNEFSFKSTDSDGDTLYYEVDWNADGYDERTPSVGYVNQNVWYPGSIGTPLTYRWDSLGTKYVKARAIDSNNESSATWTTYPVTCTLGCDHCTSGQPQVSISAFPPFVRSGETSNISWSLQGVLSCYVDSSNDADDWDWNTVRAADNHDTSAITEDTTYTLHCKNELGNDIPPVTARVTTAPAWHEN
jgi:hypothetical protein